ncbi:MAG: universal stress protein [Bacteroidetes bacterium]|jgi:nucleotide-binding universal stress UspA family protein|nr:universal stress protein [Bacteroidota bacterium]
MTKAGIPPVTFKRIATAMGFSPMAKANLAEVHRIAKRCEAQMYVFHIGEWNDRCETTYTGFLSELGIPNSDVVLVCKQGDPKEELRSLCQENSIDLLALGALVRENMFKVFTVSIARDVCRKAKVSLLLLTHSRLEGMPCERIVVNGLDHPKTLDTIRTSLWLGSKLGSKELFVVDELSEKSLINPDDDKSQLNSTRKRKQIEREQHSRIEGLLQNCQVPVNLEIKEQHVFGKRGYTIAHYAKAKRADLLVVNSPDTKLRFLDRIFKHDLEYILADLPSDVLIVHTAKDTSYA